MTLTSASTTEKFKRFLLLRLKMSWMKLGQAPNNIVRPDGCLAGKSQAKLTCRYAGSGWRIATNDVDRLFEEADRRDLEAWIDYTRKKNRRLRTWCRKDGMPTNG